MPFLSATRSGISRIGGFQVGNGILPISGNTCSSSERRALAACASVQRILPATHLRAISSKVLPLFFACFSCCFLPRIVTRAEYGAGFLTQLTRIRQRNGWVSAKRQLLLLPAKAVPSCQSLEPLGLISRSDTARRWACKAYCQTWYSGWWYRYLSAGLGLTPQALNNACRAGPEG